MSESESGGQRRGRARGLNRVQIIGNLGRDPELRFTQEGSPVANFTVAVNDSWQSRSGEQRERTEWFRVVAWGRLAEIANEYLRRGRQVYVDGRLQTREWEDREGNARTTTELVAREMLMLGGRDAEAPESTDTPSADPESVEDEITPDDLPF